LKHHPDKGGSAEMFRLLQVARETLSCESKRYGYDVKLRRHYLELELAAKPEP
jgi:curved DNA-binding protein CbpA